MDTEQPLLFQCKDILSRDVSVFADDPDERRKVYEIVLFGTNKDGQSICLKVQNFHPFFYVRVPECLSAPAHIRALETWILNGITPTEHDYVKMEKVRQKTLYDYNGGTDALFLKISVPSMYLWRSLKDRLLSKTSEPLMYELRSMFGVAVFPTSSETNDCIRSEADGRIGLKIFEANIDPVLRFFHIRDVSPAGWIRVDVWDEASDDDAVTDVYAVAEWDAVKKPEADCGMAPYLIASWDIECTSSHGDFPIAKKKWRKPVRELYEMGVPTKLHDLSTLLTEAVHGRAGPLSPIYLTVPPLSYTILHDKLVAKEERVLTALNALRNSTKESRDTAIARLSDILDELLPKIRGDEIIQIGTVLYRRGVAVSKHIWVLSQERTGDVVDKEAVKPPGADVPIESYGFRNEAALLEAWFKWVGKVRPDVLIGYNIFGFDSKYMWDRLEETTNKYRLKEAVAPFSCLASRPPRLEEKFLSSSAMGDNTMWFLSSPGFLQIDLLPYVRRNHTLDSYTLDNVSATFMSGAVQGGLKDVGDGKHWRFATKSTKGIVVGRFITLMDEENDRVVDRCEVTGVEGKALIVEIPDGARVLAEHGAAPVRWSQVKDDVSPKDIFRLHRGSALDRAKIARYCLQDCDLVMELFNKLEILNNAVAMADVCSVPVAYIFLRGQGIKIESLIFRECRLAGQLIDVLPSSVFGADKELDDAVSTASAAEDSYEGAIVLDPHTDIYIDDPVTADDFASLYPSSIISENISHDTLIWVKDYDKDGNFVCIREGSDRYDNIAGAKYVNIEFDILRVDPADTRKHPEKFRDGVRVARYIQAPQGTIPRILETLLANRKRVRKLAEKEPDEFRRALLDAQQLAYKLTANSLYGQLGSGTFKIRRQVLAASTTAYGRKQLMYAKAVIERVYGGGRDPRCDVECVYGDTDSIFLRFKPRDPVTGVRLTGQAALIVAKDLTIESGKLVSSCLKPPHDFEFDKIFRSFCLLSKKRYVGDMSEDGLEEDDFHRKSMGIVMKRRDNAPIVKYVYGGAIDRILDPMCADKASGVRDAALFVKGACRDLLTGKFPLTKLTITKSLRSEYADPTRIAHKVLADRIGERDPGNKPSTSDRIPYVYIKVTGEVKLQGDRIETPSFIRDNGLTPDYAFYITNQIAKPVSQVFGLAVAHIPGAKAADISACNSAKDPVAAREALAEKLLFESVLLEASRAPATMKSSGQLSMATFFTAAKK